MVKEWKKAGTATCGQKLSGVIYGWFWSCSSHLSLFHHYHCFWPLTSTWKFFLNLWPWIDLLVLGMAPRLDLISFWQSSHVTSKVNFGLWPHVGGLTEYLSNSSQTIHKYTIPINFWPQVAVPAFFHYFTIITVSVLWPLIETLFLNLWPRIWL